MENRTFLKVATSQYHLCFCNSSNVRSHFTFKQRNFDPETRQLRNRERDDAGEDTVEKAVEGLAEDILREDEEKRKEELVRVFCSLIRF